MNKSCYFYVTEIILLSSNYVFGPDNIRSPRFNIGEELDRRTPDCSMHVKYQRANTCYKQTEEATDWLSARAQCWSYGGDLAFPLPKDDEECTARIWSKGDEVRIKRLITYDLN